MYLKSLTALGFKSFADKTTLNFQPGITAIVGPNGCGKSNVADAVRWVLGEQSAKALRGGEMADVIFNGTDSRKAMGMAEVSITIGDVDAEQLSAAGVTMDFNEITLTRRVFRDGGSEYFINKVPCRLKDVQQLFMGTGVGRTSYSIMAQGNITQIISSKPDDRRMVFEEAAGITKFKSQKKESLRKLEHTDQNLLRVQDLIREVKRQIGSLQRQAGKARRYKQLAQELQHLDTQLARHQFDVLMGDIRGRETEQDRLRDAIEGAQENVLRGENEIGQLRNRLSELELEIHGSQQRGLELKAQAERNESRIHFNQERLHELEQQNAKALTDITQGEERRSAAEQELAAVSERLAASESQLAAHRSALEAKTSALQKVEDGLREHQEQAREAQAQLFAVAQSLTRARNEINALDLQKQGNVVRLEKLSAEKIQLEEERGRLDVRLTEFNANVEAEKLNVQTTRGTVEQRQARLKELATQLQQVSAELDGLLHGQAGKRSQLTVLEQLQESHEGFGAGALAALKQSQSVLGSLADKIRVPDQYVTAIEAALGSQLQLVLTEQPESAQQILVDLSANKKGRASIAALGLRNSESRIQNPESVPAGAVSALQIVEADDSVKPLLGILLGRTLIVPDLAAATAAWRETSGAFDFVTHTGELLNRAGVFTGGAASSASGKPTSSILSRKNQLAGLRKEIEALQAKIGDLSRNKGALTGEQTDLQSSLAQAQTELRTQEVAIATRQGEFNALQTSLRTLHQKIDTVVYEIQSLADTDREGIAKRAKLAAELSDLETGERESQQSLAGLNAAIEALRVERDTANAALTEAKVNLAAEEQLCASFRAQRAPLETRIAELNQIITQRKSECSSFVTRKAQFETEIAESQQHIISLTQQREQVSHQIAGLMEQKSAQDQAVQAHEESLREERRTLADSQQQRGSIEVELAQKNMQVQNLRERVQQKYQVNLDDIRSECITITLADEGPAKIQTLTPEEMAAAGAATDWDAVAAQVTEVQKRIDEMGPINLVAIEEYEEAEQRHNFLTTQNDDLVKAKEQLLEIISRINTQTRQMFLDTFEKIRENFRGTFTEIFGGGKADLILVDEGDVLESGIDIVARPPGKTLQTISLLSGGEQTMTAVALLFAIYQVKPSPFCVLDELDAPLDESNINRFLRIVQRFLVHSQFIIITHNKRTIGMADVLYGVTMQEQGVSRLVSVKFHKTEETREAQRNAHMLVPPPANGTVDAAEDAQHKREDTIVMAK
ncbi:MAG: chromosome segregation protein SMC [Verrucomicrobia bacterium]|nr:chromosome segregation protein SMC [Verrucomicrobiota bacterium]